MMIIVMMVMVMTLLEPLMMDDFDGALEMDDDGPLMEIAYVYDDWSPDDDGCLMMDGW